MDVNDWDTYYRQAASTPENSRNRGPDSLVKEIAEGIQSRGPAQKGRALDLACGAGANSLWLAENGWDVTAVDRSSAAIDLLRAKASEREVDVTMHVADLETREFKISPGEWDLILMCRYLQRDLFEPAAAGLRPGGVLIVIALLAEVGEQRFRAQPGELSAYFGGLPGFTIVHQREGATRDHSVSEIAVRREIAVRGTGIL